MNSKHATLDLFSLLTSSKMVNHVRFNLLLHNGIVGIYELTN